MLIQAQVRHAEGRHQASADGLALQLRALELRLHEPGVRASMQDLGALLHPDFLEHGRSGRRYDRAAILARLSGAGAAEAAARPPDIVTRDFECRQLSQDLALLSYRSAHRGPDGALVRHSLRASLWQRSDDGAWRMRFHQGTACEPFDLAPAGADSSAAASQT